MMREGTEPLVPVASVVEAPQPAFECMRRSGDGEGTTTGSCLVTPAETILPAVENDADDMIKDLGERIAALEAIDKKNPETALKMDILQLFQTFLFSVNAFFQFNVLVDLISNASHPFQYYCDARRRLQRCHPARTALADRARR